MTRVIGIDPGLHKTGWGVLEKMSDGKIKYISSGAIKTNPNNSLAERLLYLSENLAQTLENFKPQICAMEEVFINLNKQSSIKLCQARGALITAVASNYLELIEYSPRLIKQTVTGSGKADKDQIIKMLSIILPTATPKTEDEADSLAVAFCYLQHQKYGINA